MNITNWEWKVACGQRVFVENVEFILLFDVDVFKHVMHFVDEPTEEEL